MIGAEAARPVLVTSEDVGDQEPEMVSFTVPEGEMYGSSFDVTHGEEKDCPELRPLKMPQLGVPGLFFQSGVEDYTQESPALLPQEGLWVLRVLLSTCPVSQLLSLTYLRLRPKPCTFGLILNQLIWAHGRHSCSASKIPVSAHQRT